MQGLVSSTAKERQDLVKKLDEERQVEVSRKLDELRSIRDFCATSGRRLNSEVMNRLIESIQKYETWLKDKAERDRKEEIERKISNVRTIREGSVYQALRKELYVQMPLNDADLEQRRLFALVRALALKNDTCVDKLRKLQDTKDVGEILQKVEDELIVHH